MSRPNILLIMSDQHRADCYGFAGRRVKTPYLDRMAANGTHFTTAITPNPVCQPARASLLTGLLPLTHGVHDNNVHLDPAHAELGWGRTLANAGYRSRFIGKGHFGEHPAATPYGAPESRPNSANFPADWSGPYMGFDRAEMMILGHWHDLLPCEQPPRGHHFERWFWSRGEAGEAWRLWAEDAGPDYGAGQTWFSRLPDLWHSTTWVTDRTIDLIDNADAEQPFCAWVSYPDPHHQFDCPEPWSRLHHPDEVDISRSHALDLDQRPWWHRAALESEPQDANPIRKRLRESYSRIPPQSDRQLAAMTANYYGKISFIDHGVGRILARLEERGLADNTIVVFTSDHGDLLGDHGLYLKGPMCYEGLSRVGLIVKGPGIPAGKVVADPVSTVDLPATFYDWAGAEAPEAVANQGQSRSLRGLIEGDHASREVAWSEWNLPPARCGVNLELRTVRTRTARLTVDLLSGDGELYDLANDPDELDNRFSERSAKTLRDDLLELVHARPGGIAEPVPAALHEDNEFSPAAPR